VVKKFKFLDHTADAKFQAFGRTLEDAFGNAALATASLMWKPKTIKKKIRHPVRVSGRDLEQLLVQFLAEIIYLFETKKFLLRQVEDVRIDQNEAGFHLVGVFSGDRSAGYDLHGEVKAVTYNEMAIEEKDGFTVQVVLDI
jgi:SHS2 domain-containing protein